MPIDLDPLQMAVDDFVVGLLPSPVVLAVLASVAQGGPAFAGMAGPVSADLDW